jgi:dihydroxycyclohexadiene carboxylate dehydrogenase
VLALEADLEQWQSTEQAFAAGVAHFGRLDVLINNVGGTIWARPLPNISQNKLRKRSAARCSHPVGLPRGAPWMLKQGKGSIVNISSVATAG